MNSGQQHCYSMCEETSVAAAPQRKLMSWVVLNCFRCVPPSGSELLNSPSTVTQLLPSPPQIRHRSSRTSEPRMRSQPTCCGRGEMSELQGDSGSQVKGHSQQVERCQRPPVGLPLMSSRLLFKNAETSDGESRCVLSQNRHNALWLLNS